MTLTWPYILNQKIFLWIGLDRARARLSQPGRVGHSRAQPGSGWNLAGLAGRPEYRPLVLTSVSIDTCVGSIWAIFMNQFFSSPFNSYARGWSLWRPHLGNWILWVNLFLNRVHIFSFLISISFSHHFLKSKFLEKFLCRKKNRPRKPISNFSHIAEDQLDFNT